MLDAIIFDFDGVICESVEAKTEAFRRLFQDHPEQLDKILQFHMENGGLSRYEKFKVIYRDFLKCELTEKESLRLGQLFTEYSYDSVLKSPFVKGAYEFLCKYHNKLLLFVASGTPQDELISIVRKRKLEHFFVGIYGTPLPKVALIMKILRENKIAADKVIFVGDSINDYIGANETGIRFIGRVHQCYSNPFRDVLIETQIGDLTELDEWVGKKMR